MISLCALQFCVFLFLLRLFVIHIRNIFFLFLFSFRRFFISGFVSCGIVGAFAFVFFDIKRIWNTDATIRFISIPSISSNRKNKWFRNNYFIIKKSLNLWAKKICGRPRNRWLELPIWQGFTEKFRTKNEWLQQWMSSKALTIVLVRADFAAHVVDEIFRKILEFESFRKQGVCFRFLWTGGWQGKERDTKWGQEQAQLVRLKGQQKDSVESAYLC